MLINLIWIELKLSTVHKSGSLLWWLNQLLDLLLSQESGLLFCDYHQLDVLISGFNHVQKSLDDQLDAILIGDSVLVMFLQILAHLLGVSATSLSLPFRKRPRRISVVKMRPTVVIQTSDQSANTERSYTAFLSILLLGLSDVLWNVFDWRVIVVV